MWYRQQKIFAILTIEAYSDIVESFIANNTIEKTKKIVTAINSSIRKIGQKLFRKIPFNFKNTYYYQYVYCYSLFVQFPAVSIYSSIVHQ